MPSWDIHFKWERRILGRTFPKIDEFIDAPSKIIVRKLVEEAIKECERDLDMIDYYMDVMKSHDAWRHATCVFYYYMYKYFGEDGLKAAILHIILDLFAMNITRYSAADLVTFRKILDEFEKDLSKYNITKSCIKIMRLLRENLNEIITDIIKERKTKIMPMIDITEILVYFHPRVWKTDEAWIKHWLEREYERRGFRIISSILSFRFMDMYKKEAEIFQEVKRILSKLEQVGIKVTYINIFDLDSEESWKIWGKVRTIAMITKVSTHYSGTGTVADFDGKLLDLYGGFLIIVKYRDGREMFYPHFIRRSGMRVVEVSAIDFLKQLIQKLEGK